MKSSRFNKIYKKNASKLHRKIGDVLFNSSLSHYKIYQEYPVNKINTNYHTNRHKFDWVILDLKLIIEAHGEQHFKKTNFGGISDDEANDNLIIQKYRDNIKMQAAIDIGFTYIMIPFLDIDIISETYIMNKYKQLYNNQPPPTKPKIEEDDYKVCQKIRAKEHRQQQYRKIKEFKKNRRLDDEIKDN